MKKRFFGVLLALAVSLMAGTAFAAVGISASLSVTVGSGTAETCALSISESALSNDIGRFITVAPSQTAAEFEASLKKDKVPAFAPADVKITTDGSSAVKIASSGTTGVAFKKVLLPSYAVYGMTGGKESSLDPADFFLVDPNADPSEDDEDPGWTASISFTPVASANAYLYMKISDDSYETDRPAQVVVKLPVKVAKTDSEGNTIQTPTAFEIDDTNLPILLGNSKAKDLKLQQTLADRMGEGIHYAAISNKPKATSSEVSEIKKVASDVSVIYPSVEATVSSAYVIGLLAPDMSNFEDDHFKFDRSTKSSLEASVAKYGDAPDMGDVLYMIWDSNDEEFRDYDESDGQKDIVFMAFHLDPGKFQPFIAGGTAPSPSNPSEPGELSNPSEPSTPGSPSTPETPSTPENPSNPSSPVNPSGSHKSSGSSGCDMGMVSGLAILLAALLPLRKVRK